MSGKTVITDLEGNVVDGGEEPKASARNDPFDPSSMERIIEDDDFLIEEEPDEPVNQDLADEDDEPADDEQQDFDEDLRVYSKPVRDRIMRERRLRQTSDDEKTETAKALMGERLQRVNVEKAYIDMATANLTTEKARAESDLAKAIEEGDTKKQVEAQQALMRVAVSEQNVGQHKQRIERDLATVTEQAKQFAEHGGGQQQDGTVPLARQWMQRNVWFNNTQNEIERIAAMAIDGQLAREGWDKNTAAYYRELDRRISQKFPQLYARQQSQRQQPQQTRRAPTGGVGNQDAGPAPGARPRPGSTKVTINAADHAIMRRFNMPRDPKWLAEYARNKRQADVTHPEPRRRGR